MDERRLAYGVGLGVVAGSVLLAITGEAYWIAIGIALGAAIGYARPKDDDNP